MAQQQQQRTVYDDTENDNNHLLYVRIVTDTCPKDKEIGFLVKNDPTNDDVWYSERETEPNQNDDETWTQGINYGDVCTFIATSNIKEMKLFISDYINETQDADMWTRASEIAGLLAAHWQQRPKKEEEEGIRLELCGLEFDTFLFHQRSLGGCCVFFQPGLGGKRDLMLDFMQQFAVPEEATDARDVFRHFTEEKQLSLSICTWCDQDLFSLIMQGLEDNAALKDLKILFIDNIMDEEHGAALGRFLSNCKIEKLNFDSEMVNLPMMTGLLANLTSPSRLRCIEICDLDLKDDNPVVPHLKTMLTRMPYLEEIHILFSRGRVGKLTFKQLCEGLQDASLLRNVTLDGSIALVDQHDIEDWISFVQNHPKMENFNPGNWVNMRVPSSAVGMLQVLEFMHAKFHRVHVVWEPSDTDSVRILVADSVMRFKIFLSPRDGDPRNAKEKESWLLDSIQSAPTGMDHCVKFYTDHSWRPSVAVLACNQISSVSLFGSLKSDLLELGCSVLSHAAPSLQTLKLIQYSKFSRKKTASAVEESLAENLYMATFVDKAISNTSIPTIQADFHPLSDLLQARNRILSVKLEPVALLPRLMASFPRIESDEDASFAMTTNGRRTSAIFVALKTFAHQLKVQPKRKTATPTP